MNIHTDLAKSFDSFRAWSLLRLIVYDVHFSSTSRVFFYCMFILIVMASLLRITPIAT